jgi:hypothetical protein
MNWKFWKRKPQLTLPTGPWDLVVAPVYLFSEQKSPFADWKKVSVTFPREIEQTARCATQGFQLCIFYWMLSNKLGNALGRFVRDACLAALDSLDSQVKLGAQLEALCLLIDDAMQAGQRAAREPVTVQGQQVDVPFEYGMGLYLLIRMHGSPYYGRSDVPNEISLALAECLEQGRKVVEPLYEQMLSELPSLDVSGFPFWKFGKQPGAHERHLQRRYNNLLFPAERRAICAADVLSARVKDAEALEAAKRSVLEIHKSFEDGGWLQDLEGTRKRIYAAQERVVGVGGDDSVIFGLLRVLGDWRQFVVEAWRERARDNPQALAALDEAENIHARNEKRRLGTFGCQLMNESKPIPRDEIVPALLCEDPATVTLFVETLPENARAEAQKWAAQVGSAAGQEGFDLQTIEEQLRALGVPQPT